MPKKNRLAEKEQARWLREGARCADQLFCLGGREEGREGGDVCASETLVGGVIQQQERASQGFKISEWANIKESLGVHLPRLERRSVDSKGGNALTGWRASG